MNRDEDSKVCCFLGNFPPRECGIATFTRDLTYAMNRKFNPKLKSRIVALNEEGSFYNYNNKVIMQFNKDNIEEYIDYAKKINRLKNIKIVCIQHEFGIFGGEYGNYIIPFLETIEKPVAITFHSVLPDPDPIRKRIVHHICSKCDAIIVMAKKAVEILKEDYGVDGDKIHVVYHGIPNAPFQNSEISKKNLNLSGKIVLSTFGLLSRGKGQEYMIEALPKLVEKYPNILYLIIGETHPNIRREEGESYRNELMKKVKKLKLENNVKFYNKYLPQQEIINYLLATDIYVCTNLDPNQIVSGTLSYAMGCGKAVVSTPIIYAKEILAENRGVVVKSKNPKSYADAIDEILSDKEYKESLEGNAYTFSRAMVWSNVAAHYLSIFNQIVSLREETVKKFPPIKLNHLKNLTDDFGVLQFAKIIEPDKTSGYTIDDNSRALITTILHNKLFKSKQSLDLSRIYLDFLEYARDESGWFNNVIKDGKMIDDSEDAFGRALWALGFLIDKCGDEKHLEKSKRIFEESMEHLDKVNSPRSKAFCLMGLYYYHKKYPNDENLEKIKNLTNFLVELYEEESSDTWHWFENQVTYSNSKLSEALFLAYELTKDEKYLEVAKKTLDFLSDILFIDGKLSPIGQNGWYNKNGKRAFYDQQPVDASEMVQTYLIAYHITKDPKYYDNAILAFNWFLGKNHLNQMVYDERTGGCYDGVARESVNLNQGAESTISYLTARLFLEAVNRNEELI